MQALPLDPSLQEHHEVSGFQALGLWELRMARGAEVTGPGQPALPALSGHREGTALHAQTQPSRKQVLLPAPETT